MPQPSWPFPSTFQGRKLLQLPVLAEVEAGGALPSLLLDNLGPPWVLDFAELCGGRRAVARTLVGWWRLRWWLRWRLRLGLGLVKRASHWSALAKLRFPPQAWPTAQPRVRLCLYGPGQQAAASRPEGAKTRVRHNCGTWPWKGAV